MKPIKIDVIIPPTKYILYIFHQVRNTTVIPTRPISDSNPPHIDGIPKIDKLPCQTNIDIVIATTSPKIRANLNILDHPNSRMVHTQKTAIETINPIHEPRLNVNNNPSNCIDISRPHTAKIAIILRTLRTLLLGILSSALSTLAIAKDMVIAIDIPITAAAKIALPIKEVIRPDPPPVTSVKFRKSC